MTANILAGVQMAPRDPILGLTELYNADKNPKKVNLGVGVYYDDAGKVPVLECVRRAESELAKTAAPRAYLPIDGLPAYDSAVQQLVFGADCPALNEKRIVTVQALGGTGGLKVGADFLRRFAPKSELWISDPSWENHRALFETAGFTVNAYPYYDAASHGVNFKAMIDALGKLRDTRAVPLVLERMENSDSGVKYAALFSLGFFDDARAVDAHIIAQEPDQRRSSPCLEPTRPASCLINRCSH